MSYMPHKNFRAELQRVVYTLWPFFGDRFDEANNLLTFAARNEETRCFESRII